MIHQHAPKSRLYAILEPPATCSKLSFHPTSSSRLLLSPCLYMSNSEPTLRLLRGTSKTTHDIISPVRQQRNRPHHDPAKTFFPTAAVQHNMYPESRGLRYLANNGTLACGVGSFSPRLKRMKVTRNANPRQLMPTTNRKDNKRDRKTKTKWSITHSACPMEPPVWPQECSTLSMS